MNKAEIAEVLLTYYPENAVKKWLETGIPLAKIPSIVDDTGLDPFDLRPDKYAQSGEQLSTYKLRMYLFVLQRLGFTKSSELAAHIRKATGKKIALRQIGQWKRLGIPARYAQLISDLTNNYFTPTDINPDFPKLRENQCPLMNKVIDQYPSMLALAEELDLNRQAIYNMRNSGKIPEDVLYRFVEYSLITLNDIDAHRQWRKTRTGCACPTVCGTVTLHSQNHPEPSTALLNAIDLQTPTSG